MVEEKSEKEIILLKQSYEEKENSLLEKIKELETELESLKLQHQLDTKGKEDSTHCTHSRTYTHMHLQIRTHSCVHTLSAHPLICTLHAHT